MIVFSMSKICLSLYHFVSFYHSVLLTLTWCHHPLLYLSFLIITWLEKKRGGDACIHTIFTPSPLSHIYLILNSFLTSIIIHLLTLCCPKKQFTSSFLIPSSEFLFNHLKTRKPHLPFISSSFLSVSISPISHTTLNLIILFACYNNHLITTLSLLITSYCIFSSQTKSFSFSTPFPKYLSKFLFLFFYLFIVKNSITFASYPYLCPSLSLFLVPNTLSVYCTYQYTVLKPLFLCNSTFFMLYHRRMVYHSF